MTWTHDFAITERRLVFVIDPMTINLSALPAFMLGLRAMDEALRFRADHGTTVVIVPRGGGTPRIATTDALLHFHVGNAFEAGPDTAVDLVCYDQAWDEFNQSLRRIRSDGGRGLYTGGRLTRLRVSPEGHVRVARLSDTPAEFPQIDPRRVGRPHRYSYVAARTGRSPTFNAIVRIDHQGRGDVEHELPAGQVVSEPIFVPRSAPAAEDDGFVLAVAYNPTEHRSRLLILDARAPQRTPLFVGHLRHHIPPRFHGTFTSRVARPSREGCR